MTDWLRKGGSYFAIRVETDRWGISGGRDVSYWREPLTALCGTVADAGFLIERLVEPLPAPTMAEQYPDAAARLSERPEFLVLRLLRR